MKGRLKKTGNKFYALYDLDRSKEVVMKNAIKLWIWKKYIGHKTKKGEIENCIISEEK